MRVAAGVIVLRGAEVLALRRSDRHGVGLPCGHVEDGESPEVCALREAEEETGLVLALVPGAPPYIAVDPVGGKLVHTFLATVSGGTLRGEVPGEGTPCWTTPAELAAGPYADYNRRAFEFFGIRY